LNDTAPDRAVLGGRERLETLPRRRRLLGTRPERPVRSPAISCLVILQRWKSFTVTSRKPRAAKALRTASYVHVEQLWPLMVVRLRPLRRSALRVVIVITAVTASIV
jgi:hypothetical protein